MEVLVAVAIVGLAMPAMLYTVMQRIDGTAYMRERMISSWVATNKLTELHLRNMEKGEILKGTEEGSSEMASIRWGWSLDSHATGTEFQYRVEVRVWLDSDPQRAPLSSMISYLHDLEGMREANDFPEEVSTP